MSDFEGFDQEPPIEVPPVTREIKPPKTTGQSPKKRGEAPTELKATLSPRKSRPIARPYDDVADEDLTPEMEQEIRDFLGYAPSETRTRAERQATADRIVSKAPEIELPPDLAEIWGDSPIARRLVAEWGVEGFRASELHSTALLEAARDSALAPLRKAFVKQHSVKAPRAVDDTNPNPEDPR